MPAVGDTVVVPRWVVEQVLEDLVSPAGFEVKPILHAALDEAPVLPRVLDVLGRFARLDAEISPAAQALLDQLRAFVTEFLAEFGFDVDDGRRLYDAAVILSLVTRLAQRGQESGSFDEPESIAIQALCRTVARALHPRSSS